MFSTLIIIWNVPWAANQHIRMIYEGSCVSEDWSNAAENSALHHRNNLQSFNSHLKLYFIISRFNCIFDQINASLVSIRICSIQETAGEKYLHDILDPRSAHSILSIPWSHRRVVVVIKKCWCKILSPLPSKKNQEVISCSNRSK